MWLIITFLLISCGFFINLKTDKRKGLLGAQLPIMGLTSTEGNIEKINYRGTTRRGTFVNPAIVFQHNGKTYQTATMQWYKDTYFPYSRGQNVEVVFVTDEPEKAWLRWEYNAKLAEYNGFFVRADELIKPVYNYLAVGIIILSGLFFLVALFVPLRNPFPF